MENTLFPAKETMRKILISNPLFFIRILILVVILLAYFLYFPFSYIVPAVGLAAVAAKALTITDEDFIVAAKTLAELVPQKKLKDGCCYPDLSNIREVSQKIAVAVAKHIFETGRSDWKDVNDFDEGWLKFSNEATYFESDPVSVKPMPKEPEYCRPSWSSNHGTITY
jgi:hypothetical protein